MQETESAKKIEARRRALRALSIRAHFPSELILKLIRRGIEEPIARKVVQALQKERPEVFQDVDLYVARRLAAGKSRRRIAQLLFQKGFPPHEALRYAKMEDR